MSDDDIEMRPGRGYDAMASMRAAKNAAHVNPSSAPNLISDMAIHNSKT
jgi:hypothetical protein